MSSAGPEIDGTGLMDIIYGKELGLKECSHNLKGRPEHVAPNYGPGMVFKIHQLIY